MRSTLYFFAVFTSCTHRNGGTVTGFASLNVRSFAHVFVCFAYFVLFCLVSSTAEEVCFFRGYVPLPRSAHAI